MKDRIIKFLTHEKISSTKFADEIGVQRSSISHILSGRNNPGFEHIQKILLRYKNLNADWLITGNGNMLKRVEQQSLFDIPISSGNSNQPNVPQIPENTEVFTTKNEILSAPEAVINSLPVPKVEKNASRTVERTIIFYTDKTFVEYLPSK